MRVPNDRILANKVKEIDIVLGGHDHTYCVEVDKDTGVFLVKSGTDFECFSDIKMVCNVNKEQANTFMSERAPKIKSHLIEVLYAE